MDNKINIQALKYGNKFHYEWNTTLLEKRDTGIFVLGEYGRKLHHYTKQKVFTVENWTIEYFSFDSWFTVSADVVAGEIKQYYCNINEPAKLNGQIVSFVDLDLDYVQRNGKWSILDEDEFETNAIKFNYPDYLVQRARAELKDLQRRIRDNNYPFDGTLESFIDRIPQLFY